MSETFSYNDLIPYCIKTKGLHLGRFLLMVSLVYFFIGIALPAYNASAQEASVFTGSSPPVTNSSGILVLNDDFQNENTFQWQSLDSILGEIDTETVTATRWTYLPGSPARLVFAGSSDGATIHGNVIFGDYNRAVVDIVKGSKRVRYLLNGVTGEVAWVDDNFNEPDFVSTLSKEDLEPFDHDPGEPGGPGGFGGPPAASGIPALADPFRIEDLEIDDESDLFPATMTLTLTSNVASWTQTFVLMETSADSDTFVDADDSLAIQVIEYSSGMVDTIDTMQLFVVSMAFGTRRNMTVFETWEDTDIFVSEHLELVVTMTELPDPGAIDIITVTLLSNLELDVVIDTLTETGDDTLVFESSDGALSIIIDRITANGSAAKDDLTAFVTSELLKVTSAEVDAIETGPDTLEFRTDALHNENSPGNGSGALRGLAIGSKWKAALKVKNSDPWPYGNQYQVTVAVQRKRGKDTVVTRTYQLQWHKDKYKSKGDFRYHYLVVETGKKVDGEETFRPVYLILVETGLFCTRDGGNLKAQVQPGDRLIASRWKKPWDKKTIEDKPKDEVIVVGVDLDVDTDMNNKIDDTGRQKGDETESHYY